MAITGKPDETATGLVAAIRNKEISPVEIVDDVVERIEAINPAINAVVVKGYDDARAAAKKAEQAIMDGAPLGPLHGLPILIKDLFESKPGWVATMGGIRALKDAVSDSYSAFPKRMEESGAIIVGATNSPVFGFRGATDNYLFGPSRNPFDLDRNTGGSSGGSAGAVAAGIVPVAEGTDGGGSVRIPSSWSGTFGFIASFGRAPLPARPNAFGNIAPYIFAGPISRSVADGALMASVNIRFDRRDPLSMNAPLDAEAALVRSIAGKRIAYTRNYGIFPVDPRITAVTDEAVKTFEDLGAIVEEVDPKIPYDQQTLSDLWCRQITPASQFILDTLKANGTDLLGDHPEDLPPELRAWLEKGEQLTVADLFKDQVIRTEVFEAIQIVFDDYDFIVSPTLAALPVLNADDGNTVGPSEINGEAIDPLIGWCMTYLMNFVGGPAATVPAGLADGLPVGMQIAGSRLNDEDVIAASAAFEAARPWRQTYRALSF